MPPSAAWRRQKQSLRGTQQWIPGVSEQLFSSFLPRFSVYSTHHCQFVFLSDLFLLRYFSSKYPLPFRRPSEENSPSSRCIYFIINQRAIFKVASLIGHLHDLWHPYQWDLFNSNLCSSDLWSTALKLNYSDVSEADGQLKASHFNTIIQTQVSVPWKFEDQSVSLTFIMICGLKLTFFRLCQKLSYFMLMIFHPPWSYWSSKLF